MEQLDDTVVKPEQKQSSLQMHMQDVLTHLNSRVLGQRDLMHKLCIAMLADGHLLVEGAPGLAKTRAVKELAHCVEGKFHRIQFTPDLLPGDLTGTDIFHPEDGSFVFQPGPLFHNIVLADEINRAPAKVQSALLEAMAERQITIGSTTYPLPEVFLVMATQNPIEQEGTYPLPEAQLDRFIMYLKIGYPDAETELNILRLARQEALFDDKAATKNTNTPLLTTEQILKARQEILQVHTSEALEQYIVSLVMATRAPDKYHADLARWIEFGASPRASIALDRCAKAHAWLAHRDYVLPEDIKAVAPDVLRHRILLSFEAQAESICTDDCIAQLLRLVATP